MLRPTTLLRTFTVPIRLLAAQPKSATLLAQRSFAITARSSSSTAPPSEPPSTTTTTATPSAATTPTEPVSAEATPSNPAGSEQKPPKTPRKPRIKLAGIRAARQEKARLRRLKQLPYRVSRTPSLQLAVYELAKRGGNLKLTTVKKVEGDRAAFRADLARGLGFEEGDRKAVWVNSLTGHVIVAGHRKNEVVGWLEKQGF